jgi:cyclopropane fatty-acyl-phospholipid synthase-like methyltransferase
MVSRKSKDERAGFYSDEQKFYLENYWKDDNASVYQSNGFQSLPENTYQAFSEQVDKDGKVLDLGCGNGLMLKYLMKCSGFKLIPYGADFMEKSIKQAKKIIHPDHAKNFITCNVVDYPFKKNFFDLIFTFLNHVYPKDRKEYLEKVKESCKEGGKIVFYEYSDVMNFRSCSWVGNFPEIKNLKLEERNYPGVSIAIWKKALKP